MAGIYVHIPFCARRCVYCDFFSVTQHSFMDAYINALIKEAKCRRTELHDAVFRTMYLGGGTPSQLSVERLIALVNGLRNVLLLNNLQEFTIEVNPDDVSLFYMKWLHSIGVNRVSMGVQSFVDDELKLMQRRHDAQAVSAAIENIRQAGIDNISIDLIYGIPGQTMDTWRYSIDQAIATAAQHISAYSLSYEEGTPLWQMRESGQVKEIDEDTCIAMYNMLVESLSAAGFEHYEISNFAKSGFHSCHNSSYWDGTPYLGLGAAAHSFDGQLRRYNPSDIEEYLLKVNSDGIAYEEEHLQWWERYDELVMLALRAHGVDLSMVHERFGQDVYNYIIGCAERHISAGNLTVNNGRLRLTSDGVMLSDSVIRDLMWNH